MLWSLGFLISVGLIFGGLWWLNDNLSEEKREQMKLLGLRITNEIEEYKDKIEAKREKRKNKKKRKGERKNGVLGGETEKT